ncbi:hypothetical protein SAMN05444172_5091 [Burkholderia sp. GAS332]|nr:hypothetical protein SAMN05444172_5091 [Burkholderia sp. GAS332]
MYLVFLRLRRRVGWPCGAKNWIWKNAQRTMRGTRFGLCLRIVHGAFIYTFIWKPSGALICKLGCKLRRENQQKNQGMG